MNFFYDLYDENELYHHGIKGQKWGVRNGPPYPLGSGKDPKAFLDKYKNRTIGSLKDDWNKKSFEEKCTVISIAAAGVTAVSTVIEMAVDIHRKSKKDKIEEEREKRLQEREKRLQEQHNNKKTKEQTAGAVKKKIEDMSNNELQSEVNRLRLEQEYKKLSQQNESEASKFMKETGKQVAQQVIKSSVAILVNKFTPTAIDSLLSKANDIKTDIKTDIKIRQEEKSEKPSKSDLKQTAKAQKSRSLDNQTPIERFKYVKMKEEQAKLEKEISRERDEIKFRDRQIKNIEDALDAHYSNTEDRNEKRINELEKTLEFAKQTKSINEENMRKNYQQLRDLR